MKIAFVYDVLYPDTIGGVEKRIYEIGIRLVKRGHEVHLFPMTAGESKGITHRDGLIIHQVCRPIGLYTGGRRSVFQAFWYTIHLFLVLLKVRVDIIDCQNFPYFPVIISRIVGLLRDEYCIITWHECWGRYWYQYLGSAGIFGRLTEKIAIFLSGTSIAVSCHTASRMKEEGIHKEPFIVPNGITLADIALVKPDVKPVDLIFIGRFIPEKHPELVVEAMKILVWDYPNLTCSMIGDGPMMPTIVELIRSYGLSKHIHLAGFVNEYPDVIARMKAARIFVLPSEREGFGIVCIEAMACGLPVITIKSALNAASDHVLPECGYCAKPDAYDIATGIRIFLSLRPDERNLGVYVQQHDWDRITCSLETVYQNIMRNEKKNPECS